MAIWIMKEQPNITWPILLSNQLKLVLYHMPKVVSKFILTCVDYYPIVIEKRIHREMNISNLY